MKYYLSAMFVIIFNFFFAAQNDSYASDTQKSEYQRIYHTELYGMYEPTTNANWAIFGYLHIDGNKISWGRNKKSLSCNAEYEVVNIEKVHGSKTLKGSYDNILFAYYTLKIHNKKCDYDSMLNPHISKALGQWEIAIPSNVDNYALIRDYSENGNAGGSASAWIRAPRTK